MQIPLYVGATEMATVVCKPMKSRSAASRKASDLTYSTNVVHTTVWFTDGTWQVVRRDGLLFGEVAS